MAEAHGAFRDEIQSLRGISVLFVLAYHLKPAAFPAGFIGVDIFFVISGFVVTASILRALEAGSFSLASFYGKRVRRLLPHATVIVVLVSIYSYFILDAAESRSIRRDAVACSLFVANVNFYIRGVEYESTSAASPLLHFWSLAVEEQFYLVWPLVIMFATRGSKLFFYFVLGILGVSSFATAFWLVQVSPYEADHQMAFFLPFTRAWELAVGALAARVVADRSAPDGENAPDAADERTTLTLSSISPLLLAVLVLSGAVTPFSLVPAVGAVPAVVAAAGLMLNTEQNGANAALASNAALRWVGEASYAIYLWHWPLIVIVWGPERDIGFIDALRCGCMLLPLALLGMHLVENPIRRSKRFSGSLAGILCTLLVFASVATTLSVARLSGDFQMMPVEALPEGGHAARQSGSPGPGSVNATRGVPLLPSPEPEKQHHNTASAVHRPVLAQHLAALFNGTLTTKLPAKLRPNPKYADGDRIRARYHVKSCSGEDVWNEKGNLTIYALGDSHMKQQFLFFKGLSEKYNAKVVYRNCDACMFPYELVVKRSRKCVEYSQQSRRLVEADSPDVLFLHGHIMYPPVVPAELRKLEKQFPDVKLIVFMEDNPEGMSLKDVVARGKPMMTRRSQERVDLSSTLRKDFPSDAYPRTVFFEINSLFCVENKCPSFVPPHTLVYADNGGHLTGTFASQIVEPLFDLLEEGGIGDRFRALAHSSG